ncbi:MAG: hypothetical protein J0I41_08860 [Filimonas sp.]|nr:hypothetical protein [Filimonas sp.]
MDLIDILENENDYLPQAIAAAKKELERRQLSDAEIAELKQLLVQEKKYKDAASIKFEGVKKNVQNIGLSILSAFLPGREKISADKIIKAIAIVYGIVGIALFVRNGRLLVASFAEFASWPLSNFLFIAPHILLIVGVIYFYLRKKIGWIALAIFISCISFTIVYELLQIVINWRSSFTNAGQSGIFLINMILPCIFYLCTLFIMSKKEIREMFAIDKDVAFLVIGGTSAFMVAMLLIA